MSEFTEWEVWRGYYDLGFGSDKAKEPTLVGKVACTAFETACFIYELEAALHTIKIEEQNGEDITRRDREFHYDAFSNANKWTGQYFSNQQDAWKSFPYAIREHEKKLRLVNGSKDES